MTEAEKKLLAARAVLRDEKAPVALRKQAEQANKEARETLGLPVHGRK